MTPVDHNLANDPDTPLSGVRVLDLAPGALGAIARQLVELGADVLRVEPRGGGADRTEGPCIGGVGLEFAAANLGKQSMELNLADAANVASFKSLLQDADILIEAFGLDPTAAPIDVGSIRRSYPQLVVLSVSGFGVKGAFSNWKVTGPVLHALSGELSRSGVPGRAPLLPPGDIAVSCATSQAVFVTLVAYINRLRTGLGDRLDFALLDAASQVLDPGYGSAGSAAAGVPASELPRGRPEVRHQYPIVRCADGYVRLCVLAPRQWRAMFEWMGRPESFADPSFDRLQTRFASTTLMPAIAAFFAGRRRAELQAEGQRLGVPIAAVFDLGEALVSDQVVARRAFAPVPLGGGVSAPFPDGVMAIDGRRVGIKGPAPALGEHAGGFPRSGETRAVAAWRPGEGERPLSGLRVLDLGVIVVGAEQGRLLADQGAEVVKIETAAFPDGARQTLHGGEISPAFAAGQRNKQGLGLNLRDPRGKALFLKLIAETDVLLSNFKPGTLESLGLDYPTLSAINPRLIAAESSAFGATGPWSRWLGYGPLVRAATGLTAQWRYGDDPESFSDAFTVYPDHVAARVGAIGVLALLIRRERTGRGGAVSVSQAEVMMSHMAPKIAALSLRNAGEPLSEEAEYDAPWGVYPSAGDDEWCVVTVGCDAEWVALCGVIDRRDLAADPALADREGRAAARDRIDQAVAAWLSTHRPHDAMAQLQAAGVAAGAMLRVADLPAFPYLVERGFFRRTRHPQLPESFYVETAPVRSERLPDPPDDPAPRIGEDTIRIARERLGLDPDEIAQLLDAKVLEAPERHASVSPVSVAEGLKT